MAVACLPHLPLRCCHPSRQPRQVQGQHIWLARRGRTPLPWTRCRHSTLPAAGQRHGWQGNATKKLPRQLLRGGLRGMTRERAAGTPPSCTAPTRHPAPPTSLPCWTWSATTTACACGGGQRGHAGRHAQVVRRRLPSPHKLCWRRHTRRGCRRSRRARRPGEAAAVAAQWTWHAHAGGASCAAGGTEAAAGVAACAAAAVRVAARRRHVGRGKRGGGTAWWRKWRLGRRGRPDTVGVRVRAPRRMRVWQQRQLHWRRTYLAYTWRRRWAGQTLTSGAAGRLGPCSTCTLTTQPCAGARRVSTLPAGRLGGRRVAPSATARCWRCTLR